MHSRFLGWVRMAAVVALAGLVAVAFAACGSDDDDSSTSAATGAGTSASTAEAGGTGETQDLKVVAFPTTDQAALYYAIDNGVFEKNGLNVEAEQVLDATALTAAVTSGKADVMFQALPTAITAKSSGLPLKLVSGESTMPTEGYVEILTLKDSGIKDFADLQGKKVATIALHGVFDLAARNAIAAAGGDPEDMESMAMAPTDEQSALLQGRVDAIVLNDPFLQAAKADPKIASLGNPFSTFDYTVPSASAYTTEEVATEKADAFARFQQSLQEAADAIDADRAAAEETITGYTQLTPEVVGQIGLPGYTTEVAPDAVDQISDQMSEFGWIKQPVTADELLWSAEG